MQQEEHAIVPQGLVPVWAIPSNTVIFGMFIMVPPMASIAGPSNLPYIFTASAAAMPLINILARPISSFISFMANIATLIQIQPDLVASSHNRWPWG